MKMFILDEEQLFANGQIYMGLSWVQSLKGLQAVGRNVAMAKNEPASLSAGAALTSSGVLDWAENHWEETALVTTTHKHGHKVVDYCDKPGQFWPDGQEPPFNGQKHPKHIFVTKGKHQPLKEITHNHEEINWPEDYI
ncbi:hypothetical protein DFJ58DRAFT_842649 [Suillus subalutaceus]|uniref:uncharacterized protein n=1 Tax=Suillus subalutaceus TaxID=48586 RepID=UPI001B86B4C3|nr:uncharacterized protein DFJ58DRAFT_842649 [Suillus subalutaceus]KAG1849442.1 hypothetical protein DFJ58DRAFT_842649 [Suillus subalutaceus]